MALWCLSTFWLSLGGRRFLMLFGVPWAIAMGAAAGYLYGELAALLERRGAAARWLGHAALAAALAAGLFAFTRKGVTVAKRYVPMINDSIVEPLEAIRDTAPEDAIVTDLWENGYWVKYFARRRVHHDGGTLGTHVPYWVGRFYAAGDDRRAAGILRMLNCGSDASPLAEGEKGALRRLQAAGKVPAEAFEILDNLFALDRQPAAELLRRLGLTTATTEEVLAGTHCRPTHIDPEHCFSEVRDGTVRVREHRPPFPRQIGQRLRAPLTIARMAWLARAIAPRLRRVDVVVCDLVAQVIPSIQRRARVATGGSQQSLPVVFYCHFPDRYLAPRRRGIYRAYRWPIERFEEAATGRADAVAVNSRFTAEVFRRTYPRLDLTPEILYPGVDVDLYAALPALEPAAPFRFLVISRFVPSKNAALALEALGRLATELEPEELAPCRLVLLGGYDERQRESRQVVEGLRARARELGLESRVELVLSPSDTERLEHLARSFAVVHPMVDEHFGYVPIEAMAAGRPVVAVNRAGPAETVVDGKTGFLCEATPDAFAAAMRRFLRDPVAAGRMGAAGRERAREFSRAAFGKRLESLLFRLVGR